MVELSVFEKIASPNNLIVRLEQCLRSRHKKSNCRLCLENCPTGAISFKESLAIDRSLCHRCGVCVNVCPTDTFELKDITYQSLLTEVKRESIVEFTCSLFQPEKNSIKVPCLGYLNEAVLFGAIASGSQAVRLNITQCKQCRTAAGLPVAVRSLRRANRILALFGWPKMVSMTSGKASGGYNPSQSQRYSRRELFSLLRGEMRNRVASAADSIASDREVALKTKVSLEPRLSEKRTLLLEHIKRLGQPIASWARAGGLPFAQLEVSSRCNGCGICCRFCPTGALKCYDHYDRQVIDFSSGDCLDCNLCYDICPEGAISYSTDINPNDLVTDSRKILVEHKKSACSQCGQTHVTVPGSTLCLDCRKTKGLKEWLVTKRIA